MVVAWPGTPMTMNRDNPDGYRFFLDMGPNKNADAKYFGDKLAFWDSMMAHPNYDSFWQKRSLAPPGSSKSLTSPRSLTCSAPATRLTPPSPRSSTAR